MNIHERVRASIMAHRIGDALGMPVETMTAEEILKLGGGKPLTEMIDGVQRKLTDTANLKKGSTTDDTQLGDAVMRSLIRCGGFNLEDMVREHLYEYDRSVFGWGGTTRQAMESFKAGRHPTAPIRWAEVKPGKRPKGRGNGPIMKIHGLALWHALRQGRFETEPLLTDTIALGRMTHPDVRASIAAYAVAVVIAKVLHEPIPGDAGRDARADFLQSVIRQVQIAEERYRLLAGGIEENSDVVSVRLKHLYATYESSIFHEVNPPGFDALDSVAFTIGLFLRHWNSVEEGLIEAVNAGGDTDTHAAIAGAMIGANGEGWADDAVTKVIIPDRWRFVMPDAGAEGLKLADSLYAAVNNESAKGDPFSKLPRC